MRPYEHDPKAIAASNLREAARKYGGAWLGGGGASFREVEDTEKKLEEAALAFAAASNAKRTRRT